MAANNGSFETITKLSQITVTNSTTLEQDYIGAMRFTIAVVLVYGVGVIGLLGISTHRNRRKEQMDKEVHRFIKLKLTQYAERRLARRRANSTILKLIGSLHPFARDNEPQLSAVSHPWYASRSLPQTYGPGRAMPLPLVGHANTWSGYTKGYQHLGNSSSTSKPRPFQLNKELHLELDSISDQSSDDCSSTMPEVLSKINKENINCHESVDQPMSFRTCHGSVDQPMSYKDDHMKVFKNDQDQYLNKSNNFVTEHEKHMQLRINSPIDQRQSTHIHHLYSFQHTHV